MTQHGAGWIIFEESYMNGTKELVSILPARRSTRDVSEFMRQTYIDRRASIEHRLAFKKSPRSDPYQVMMGRHMNPLHIGHDPFLVGIYAHKIALNGNSLDFTFRILVSVDQNLVPTFEDRQQSITVAA